MIEKCHKRILYAHSFSLCAFFHASSQDQDSEENPKTVKNKGLSPSEVTGSGKTTQNRERNPHPVILLDPASESYF
jgi:hypothetical protein